MQNILNNFWVKNNWVLYIIGSLLTIIASIQMYDSNDNDLHNLSGIIFLAVFVLCIISCFNAFPVFVEELRKYLKEDYAILEIFLFVCIFFPIVVVSGLSYFFVYIYKHYLFQTIVFISGIIPLLLLFCSKFLFRKIKRIIKINYNMNFFAITPFILQTTVYPLTWIGFRIFTKIKIFGKENIRGHKSNVIFAVNHSSELDPILIPATLNPFSRLMPMFYIARERSFYPVAKKGGILKYIYGGTFFKIWGAYPVTVGTKGDYEVALKHHISILEKGQSVCIFPEGKKTKDGEIGEGKSGVGYLVWRTGKSVIPVSIKGHYKMTIRDFFIAKNKIVVSYGKILTKKELFGEKLGTNQPTGEQLKTATQTIMSHIKKMHQKI